MASEGLLGTLRTAWLTLEPLELPMALIGGLALGAWSHARFTRDADLLIAADESRIDDILGALSTAGFHSKHSPPVVKIDDQKIVQVLHVPPEGISPYQIDLLLAGSDYHRTALTRRVTYDIPDLDQSIQVLRPDDLILLKLLAARIIDRADAAMLLRENPDEIDLSYLLPWIKELDLSAGFAEIWQEAFPNEPIPELPGPS